MAENESNPLTQDPRKLGVWLCNQALKAARDGKIQVYTSMLSIAECTAIEPDLPSPPAKIKRFFDMLLMSGKSGITLVQMRHIIAVRARDLRWASEINLKGADAVHVATAMERKCDELWTWDGGIWKRRVEIAELGLTVVNPQDTKILPENDRSPELSFLQNDITE